MTYTLFWKDQTSICPHCGGLLRTCKSDEIILNCVDCNAFFRAIGHGKAEAELRFEEVEVK